MKAAGGAGVLVGVILTVGICLCFAHDGSDEHDHLHHSHFADLAKVPDKARARPNPLQGDPDAIPAGKKLFAQHCAECHGSTAEGGKKAPNLRAEEVQNATPGTLFWIVSNGIVRRGMPVWSKLPEPERWQIIKYVKSLPLGGESMEPSMHHHDSH
jgi:cytochrome c